jgi:serine/threonine-protein kinase HipA
MAMAVEGTHRHDHWWQIQRRHFNHMAHKYGYSQGAEAQIQHLIEAIPRVIEAVSQQLPADFPPSLADAIFSGLTASALTLSQMPAS